MKWVQKFVGKIGGKRLVWGFENDQNMLKQAHIDIEEGWENV